MSPTWAQVAANDMKSPRTQTNIFRTPNPTKSPQRVCNPSPTEEIESMKPKNKTRQQQADTTYRTCEELQEKNCPDNPVIMDQTDPNKPNPRPKAKTIRNSGEISQENPGPQFASQTIEIPADAHERITIKVRGQIRDGIYSEVRSEVREQIVDDYFRSDAVQDAMSHIICADAFCKQQIPVEGIKGRWATCGPCSKKTCVMYSCSLLERSHLNGGWQICPDGAAAMGLERIARARKWKRCEGCHRFLLKAENDKGKDLPCSHCADSREAGK